ncbi:hypothetical protein niasHS_007243 [Heterodera schachtii]|uniref:Uncharacterized protein n=1 Tax=Heterodera schachtii TaxID=97005 RepID=A0ABD2JJV7_HETSC
MARFLSVSIDCYLTLCLYVVATAVGARSPLGQSANLGRATANAILTTIFTRPDEFVIWRYFYIHFFGAFCSAIIGAAIFWIVKCALVDNQSP